MVAKKFLEKFRYTKENLAADNKNVDDAGENDPAFQSPEKQHWNAEHCNQIYHKLWNVSDYGIINKKKAYSSPHFPLETGMLVLL